jgi:pimeloyl-ACP methyl ester carboxylesterase
MDIEEVNSKPSFIATKSIRTEYPLFIYLPGMDGTGELLRSQTAGLEKAFDIRCLAIPQKHLVSWDILASNVLELIQAELFKNSQRVVYLCGESFGGCLAMKVAVTAPQIFKRIILINPASSLNRYSWVSWASQVTGLVPDGFYHVGALGLLPFLASLERIEKSDRLELLRTMRTVPPETISWRLSLLREFNMDDQLLGKITPPVLLIASASDRLLPSLPEAKHLVKILPKAKIFVLPNSGHACLLEKDTNLYEVLTKNNFLENPIF